MPWVFLLWLLSFFLVAALLGIDMYTLICLSDLENDFVNPHDCASRMNMFALPELGLHTFLAALHLLSGRFLMVLINLPLLIFHFHRFLCNEHLMDVTEIFNQLPPEKKVRFIKFFFYIFLFVIVVYKSVETGVNTLVESSHKTF
eukprot:TRINITY_DN4693_c0_g1_i1.p1 TRINITY_DN4693_c0_g1~~TRINITY_DN4693_c0_g1_i1.p1  ORF type:complete len:145 (+),score=33.63 TRINITY_DN4693_c0_g1_i1:279-713(+)